MFSKFELTNKGVELLNRVITEQKTLKFTKFQIGKGDFSGDKKTLTQLVSKIDEFNVSQTNVLADGITNIKGFYDNRNLSIASKLTEIGIMAQLGDDSLTEVLFSYSNQASADAETVPSKESYFSRTFSVTNKTDNVTSVTFDLTIRQDKYNFGTLEEMKSADYLDVGDKVTLWGETELGDTPFRMYIITDEVQDIQLNNLLYAREYFAIVNSLISDSVHTALSGNMGKQLNDDKQDKIDNSLKTSSKNIVGAINELFCPYKVGDIFLTTNATNPSTVWLGTTWQKIEGRMLLGTSGSGASKATGGSNTVKLSTANLPSHTHSASQSAHTHSRGTQDITGSVNNNYGTNNGYINTASGAFVLASSVAYGIGGSNAWSGTHYKGFSFTASRTWSGASSSAQPSVSIGATGSGTAFSILSAYYTVHMWLRTA